jgi:type IV pilus assembly protein PilP
VAACLTVAIFTAGLAFAQDVARTTPPGSDAVAQTSMSPPSSPSGGGVPPLAEAMLNPEHGGFTYDASGRRDPFAPVIQRQDGQSSFDATLPPLQRVGLTELNLIGIVWGGYGYTAMVQTPDGRGYAVRRGTRIGPNNGVVSAITEKGIIVQERFTDLYGKKQEREYVKLLHTKEGSE